MFLLKQNQKAGWQDHVFIEEHRERAIIFTKFYITDDGMQRLYDEGVDMLSSPIVISRYF